MLSLIEYIFVIVLSFFIDSVFVLIVFIILEFFDIGINVFESLFVKFVVIVLFFFIVLFKSVKVNVVLYLFIFLIFIFLSIFVMLLLIFGVGVKDRFIILVGILSFLFVYCKISWLVFVILNVIFFIVL